MPPQTHLPRHCCPGISGAGSAAQEWSAEYGRECMQCSPWSWHLSSQHILTQVSSSAQRHLSGCSRNQPLTGCLMSLPGKLQMCDKPLRYQLQGDFVWTEDLNSLLAGLPNNVRLVCLSIEGVSCKVGCTAIAAIARRPAGAAAARCKSAGFATDTSATRRSSSAAPKQPMLGPIPQMHKSSA